MVMTSSRTLADAFESPDHAHWYRLPTRPNSAVAPPPPPPPPRSEQFERLACDSDVADEFAIRVRIDLHDVAVGLMLLGQRSSRREPAEFDRIHRNHAVMRGSALGCDDSGWTTFESARPVGLPTAPGNCPVELFMSVTGGASSIVWVRSVSAP